MSYANRRSGSRQGTGIEVRTTGYVILCCMRVVFSVHIHILQLLQPSPLPLNAFPLALLAKNRFQVFGSSVHILYIIGVLEWTRTMQIR